MGPAVIAGSGVGVRGGSTVGVASAAVARGVDCTEVAGAGAAAVRVMVADGVSVSGASVTSSVGEGSAVGDGAWDGEGTVVGAATWSESRRLSSSITAMTITHAATINASPGKIR